MLVVEGDELDADALAFQWMAFGIERQFALDYAAATMRIRLCMLPVCQSSRIPASTIG